MPGIIVSRPIFNTLFKLAHDEGLSINAFLTKLLEKSGPDAIAGAQATATPTDAPAATPDQPTPVMAGSEQSDIVAATPDVKRHDIQPISYDDEPAAQETPAASASGSRIGNSVWDKVGWWLWLWWWWWW